MTGHKSYLIEWSLLTSSTVGEKYDLRQLQQAVRGTTPRRVLLPPAVAYSLPPFACCHVLSWNILATCGRFMGKTVYTWSGNRAKMLFLLCRVDTFAVIVGTRRRKHKAGRAALWTELRRLLWGVGWRICQLRCCLPPSLAGVFASDEMTVFVKNHDFLGIYFRSCKSYIAVTQKIRITILTYPCTISVHG